MSSAEWDNAVLLCRVCFGMALGLSFLVFENLDKFVANVWRHMYHSPIVQNDSFEPLLSTCSFFLWINVFRFFDRYNLLQAYRIIPVEKAMPNWGEGTSNSAFSQNRNLFYLLRPFYFMIPQTWRGLAAIAYLAPLLLFDSIYPRRVLPEEPPTFHGLLGSVCLSIFCYDFAFYWIHLAMHRVKVFYIVHRTHHAAEALCAVEVIHHSLVDGTLQVVSPESAARPIAFALYVQHSATQWGASRWKKHALLTLFLTGRDQYRRAQFPSSAPACPRPARCDRHLPPH
jgi:hypothetical protein